MIPAIIEDYITKLTDKSIRVENRQFYYSSLLEIRKNVENAITNYEMEKLKDENSNHNRHAHRSSRRQ